MILAKKKKIIEFIVIFILSCIICNGFIRMHYTTDTYKIVDEGYKNYAIKWSLKDGRIIMAGLLYLCSIINLKIEIVNYVFTISGIAISCISVMIMKNIVLEIIKDISIKKEIVIFVLCYFSVFSFMYIEAIYFLEIIIISLSILFYMLSIRARINRDNLFVLKSIVYAVLRNCFISRNYYIFYGTFIIVSNTRK